jgi:hypothetical protein
MKNEIKIKSMLKVKKKYLEDCGYFDEYDKTKVKGFIEGLEWVLKNE